jgi:hypothetical protein
MMKKFEFLLGDWDLEYNVPESGFSKKSSGSGVGSIKRALNDKYVYFDYLATLTIGSGAAHAIFAWDEKSRIYRYWWFENSGNFLTATCNFIGDDILFLNWHETLLIQSFTKVNRDKIVLRMEQPVAQNKFELILEVIFTRK